MLENADSGFIVIAIISVSTSVMRGVVSECIESPEVEALWI